MGLAIVLFFVVHAIERYPTPDGRLAFITQLDNIVHDTRLNLTLPGGVDPNIVILDIDEKSLGEIGHWPWNRGLMAELVGKLFDRYGIDLLGFDVVWAERDTSSGIDTLDALAQKDFRQVAGFQQAYKSLRPALDNDELFDEAARFVVQSGQASTSMLQRRFRIGFSRAGRLIDLMERDGIIGAADGSKPREILVPADYYETVDAWPK